MNGESQKFERKREVGRCSSRGTYSRSNESKPWNQRAPKDLWFEFRGIQVLLVSLSRSRDSAERITEEQTGAVQPDDPRRPGG